MSAGVIDAEGPRECEIAIVGEAPGAYEDIQGRPFVGPAGRLLNACLTSARLTRNQIYLTNLVNIRPTKNDISPYFRKVNKADWVRYKVAGCLVAQVLKGWDQQTFDYYALTQEGMVHRERLIEELKGTTASVIVPMGNSATFALLGIAGITKLRGSPFRCEIPGLEGRIIVPAIHPAASLRGQFTQRFLIQSDLKKARTISIEIRRKGKWCPPKRDLRINLSIEEAVAEFEHLKRKADEVAFDIETTAGTNIVCLGLSAHPDRATVIPTSGSKYRKSEQKKLWEEIQGLFSHDGIRKIGQNLIYDTFMMQYFKGIQWGNDLEDTMILHGVVYPELPKGLDALCATYTMEPFYKEDGKAAKKVHDFEQFQIYNAKDACVTLEVWRQLKHHLDDPEHSKTYKNTMALLPSLRFMMEKGIKIDGGSVRAKEREAKGEVEKLKKELQGIVGRSLLGPGGNVSTAKAQSYFYDELGIEPYINRKTGRPTLDDTALARLARATQKREGVPAAALIQEIRGKDKMIGTYLEMELDDDGRFRTSYKPKGTKTGRLAAAQSYWNTGGNAQNQPPLFRGYMCADPGYFMGEVDVSQAEWVVVANESGEPRMLEILHSKKDPHAATAHLMTGISEECIKLEDKRSNKSTDPRIIDETRGELIAEGWSELRVAKWLPRNMTLRQCGKKANHGLNYDEAYKTFSLSNGISENEAKIIIDLYHKAYPGIRKWHEDIQFKLDTGRTLVNCLGRKWKFLGALGPDMYRQAYAFIPQSTVVDGVNQGMVYTHRHLSRVELLLQNHDALLFQYRFEAVEFFHRDVVQIGESMTPTLTGKVGEYRLGTDLKLGMNWGVMAEVSMDRTKIETKVTELHGAYKDSS